MKREYLQNTDPSSCYFNSQNQLRNDIMIGWKNTSISMTYSVQSSMALDLIFQLMLELVEEITNALNNKKYAIGVFVYLKKVFDTVDHDILSKKVYFYGMRGIARKRIVSYLENRKQFVQYKNCESDMLNVCCGVPQGSILEPKLLIILSIKGIQLWNSLESSQIFCRNVHLFKKKIMKLKFLIIIYLI